MEKIKVTIEDVMFYAWSHAVTQIYEAADRGDKKDVAFWDEIADRISDVLYDLNPNWIKEREDEM